MHEWVNVLFTLNLKHLKHLKHLKCYKIYFIENSKHNCFTNFASVH